MMNLNVILTGISLMVFFSGCSDSMIEGKKVAYCDSVEVFSWCYVFPQKKDTIGYTVCTTAQRKKPSLIINLRNRKACIRESADIEGLYNTIFNNYVNLESAPEYNPNSRFIFLSHKGNYRDTIVVVNSRCIFNVNKRNLVYYNFNLFDKLKNLKFYETLKSEFVPPSTDSLE